MTVSVKRSAPPAPRPRALVLLDPRGAFASVKVRPLSGLVFTVMLGFAVLPPIAFLAKADLGAVVKKELVRSGALDSMSADQRAALVETATTKGAKAMKVALPVGAVVKRAMWMALLAGLCFALLRGARPALTLEAVLGAAALGVAPLAVHDVLTALTFAAKDVMAIDAQNAVLSNPAAWLDRTTAHDVVATALKGLDFFELWACALVALGVNVVAGARSWTPWAVAFGAHACTTGLALVGAVF